MESDRPPGEATAALRARVFALAIPLVLLNTWWVIQMEHIHGGPYPTTLSLFANALALLMLLLGWNALAARVRPSCILTRAELLCLYVMLTMGTALAGEDAIPLLIASMVYPFSSSAPHNAWSAPFGEHLPRWTMVSDPEAIKLYYAGNSSFWSANILSVWIGPVVWWLAFLTILVFAGACLNVILRAQWSENEKLTYPIAQIPLEITEQRVSLWRNGAMWFGFGLAAGIGLYNGIAFLAPGVPAIRLSMYHLMTGLVKPWSAIGDLPLYCNPTAIGIAYLMPTDLLFSLWFFYLLGKAQLVISCAMGWDASPGFPFRAQQSLGGYVGIVLMVLWSARRHLRQVWLKTIGKDSRVDDSREAMRFRTAVWGFGLSLLALVWFATRMGMSPLLALFAFGLYFILAIAVARMRAEFGPPAHDLYGLGPTMSFPVLAGTRAFSASDLTSLNSLFWFNRCYRWHPMAIGIESMRMAEVSRSSQRGFLAAIMIGTLVGGLGAFGCWLHLAYSGGVGTGHFRSSGGAAYEGYKWLDSWLRSPVGPNIGASLATAAGFVFCVFLSLMRIHFVGWPFHPIGFALSSDWSMGLLWVPALIAWAAKAGIIRYGGRKLYIRLLPFFIGLVMGEMAVGSMWGAIQTITGQKMYSFWPW